ncbi:zinc finger C2HC domain-containing protein 1A-like [Schistocerca cancellata]|uniref:zinc finger C2HC domain-containing protein 1A-like n=1 Tax=Schistocerca cancellata TaxID=274614 RepID=UPI0021195E8A|nr:zinc finger C2HC domain-containing protein 1A-like [Schistocerca cancellata]
MEEETPLLVPCSICGRTFKPESLEKHYKACERNSTKKRKVFDSTIQRIQGTDLAEFLPKILTNKITERTSPRSPRNKPEKLTEHNKPERKKTPDIKSKSGITSVSPKPRDSEQCPHCERSFCLKAFERHVEWCKDRRAPVTLSPNTLKAKEMLDARLKYTAPKYTKNKKKQVSEKPGTQSDIHEEKASTHHSANEFGVEKVNDIARCKSQLSRAKESLSAPSCNLSKRCSSEARLTELSPQLVDKSEQPSNLHDGKGSYSDTTRCIKTVTNDMRQQLADASNNMPFGSGTTERRGLSLNDSETSMENQEYFSAENVVAESRGQDNSLSITQSCYSTDFSRDSDCYSQSSPSVLDDKVSLSVWSSRQSITTNIGGMKRAKFCHECGSKYPIEMAKFCCECGEQRLIIKDLSHSKI